MLSVKHRYFIYCFLFSLGAIPLFSQPIPFQTMENLRIDLLSFNIPGTRPVSGSMIDYMDAQGAITITNEKYDFAISGYGFFKVKNHMNNTVYYTRCGEFKRRGNAFYNENDDEILLSNDDTQKLFNSQNCNATISLF